MTPLDEIVALVEGRISLPAFMRKLEQDQALQAVLEEDITLRPYTNNGNLLLYVLQQDPSALKAQINTRDALSQFLLAKGTTHAADKGAEHLHHIILSQTPDWLDLPNSFVRRLTDKAAGLPDRKSVAKMVKGEIGASFRYLRKPPKWLQSPAWIVVDERPLVFVGQMDLGRLKHDAAQVYLFFDEARGEIQTTIQVQ
ncbi:hypothetical protein [Roseomonas sp. WA12]